MHRIKGWYNQGPWTDEVAKRKMGDLAFLWALPFLLLYIPVGYDLWHPHVARLLSLIWSFIFLYYWTTLSDSVLFRPDGENE